MKAFGTLIFIAATIGFVLYFGGFISGSANVELTDDGRSTYNQGIEDAQEGLGRLKID